jgi:LPXTG-motif cell wall-anchored protein
VTFIAKIILLALIGVALLSAPASAQSTDDSTYVEGGSSGVVDPGVGVNPAADPRDAAVLGASADTESGSLPVTGSDIAAMAAVAMVLLIGGTLLVVVRRRQLPLAA